MITARNYAAQAEVGLLRIYQSTQYGEKDREHCELMAEMIHIAEHFVIPDDGCILDDQLKGLEGNRLELPYKFITVEFWVSGGWTGGNKFKALVVAQDLDDDIFVMGAFTVSDTQAPHIAYWIPVPYGMIIPKDLHIVGMENYKKTNQKILSPGLAEILGANSCNEYIQSFVLCLEELLEALSCRNVTTVNYQDASQKNAKRIKEGKLPIYETKMLVVDTKASVSGKGEYQGGAHASPRQHLRRGHIRRHPSAGNIWIQSCVVGDSTKGTINKQYAVV